MTITYSTRLFHPRDRLSYWIEVAKKSFFEHTFRATSRKAFHGELSAGHVGSLMLARCNLDPGKATRSARDQARDDIDDIFLAIRLTGTSIVGQGARDAPHAAGEMVLLDTRQPGETLYRTPTSSVFASIPRAGLEARLGSLAPLTARPLASERPVAGLAVGFLSMLAERAGSFDEVSGSAVANQALDLVALAYSTELGLSRITLSSARATSLLRLKSVIENRLRDPDLRPAAAAAEAGISVRYANVLLSQVGSSVERYILHRRLERCRQALEDGAQAHRLIGDIAYSWGFSDLSHFVRRFRAAYGMTPGDCRRRAREREPARETQVAVPAANLAGRPVYGRHRRISPSSH